MPFLFTDKWTFLQLSGAVDERLLFYLVAFAAKGSINAPSWFIS